MAQELLLTILFGPRTVTRVAPRHQAPEFADADALEERLRAIVGLRETDVEAVRVRGRPALHELARLTGQPERARDVVGGADRQHRDRLRPTDHPLRDRTDGAVAARDHDELAGIVER